jgi:hypothetical protein
LLRIDRLQQARRSVDVVPDAVCQRGLRAAHHQFDAARGLQPQQPLPQVAAGPLVVRVGPQQRRQAGTRRRFLDGQVRQEERVLGLEREAHPTCQHEVTGAAEQQLPDRLRCSALRPGTEP